MNASETGIHEMYRCSALGNTRASYCLFAWRRYRGVFPKLHVSVDTYTQPGKPNGLATTPRELGLVWEE